MLPVFEKTIRYIGERFAYAGGAFAVYKDGKIIMHEVFGTADMDTGRPVTENSVFDIASDSKSMTTNVVSQLCDEGLLDWDAPVQKYYPEFHWGDDEYISAHMTLKDLACHRSGVCSNNFIRRTPASAYPTRKDFVEKVAMNLTMAAPFRDKFMYCNETYATMGYICELVTGKSWEDLVLERIAQPLGMDIAFRGCGDRDLPDIAMPHYNEGDVVNRTNHNQFWLNNPCGGARTNLLGFEKYMTMWASGGLLPDGTRMISEAMYKKMTTPITYWSHPAKPDACRCYGLGLAPSVYRGEKMVYHGGSINGFRSAMGFFPGKNCGWCVMINSDTQPLAVLKWLLADVCLGVLQDDYTELADRFMSTYRVPSKLADKLAPVAEISAEDKAKFYGTYYNKAYGEITFADGGDNAVQIQYFTADRPIRFRGVMTETGEYLFQDHISQFGNFITDLRFAPDGKTAKFSVCDFYTPTPFVKVK